MANTKFATVQEVSVELSNDEQITATTVQEASVVEISNEPIDFKATTQLLENAWRMPPSMAQWWCTPCGVYYYVADDGTTEHTC